MKDTLYKFLPNFFQNLMVSAFNVKAYKIRHGGSYKKFRNKFKDNRTLTLTELKETQAERFKNFINHAISNSEFYKEKFAGIQSPEKIENIRKLPIISKEEIRNNIDKVTINTNEKLLTTQTGGTTGKSLQVKNRMVNSQERFAMLDDFRSRFGYELGKKTAWYSGKNILTENDVKKNRFWKTDNLYNVRYYSTFHIKPEFLKYYVENVIKFKPEYLVGFPSTIFEVAKYGLNHNYEFPSNTVKAIFPTAETTTKEMREVIETFYKTKVYDQYASSEGAPFIFECEKGNLHLELQSGVFEVLDQDDQPSNSGRLVVTSFTTEGTPLIRYDIGDSISLHEENIECTCGNHNPIIKELLGRTSDFVYSPQNGKINIVNIANAVKDVEGVVNYRVIQNELDTIILQILKDESKYNSQQEEKFIKNWKHRLGEDMIINIEYVQEFKVANSGKFRVVENNIKHLVK